MNKTNSKKAFKLYKVNTEEHERTPSQDCFCTATAHTGVLHMPAGLSEN